MRLRLATPSDSETIREIYRPYVENTAITFETEVPTKEAFYQRVCSITDFFPYLLAEEGGEVIGYAYGHFCFERVAYRYNAELSVYVKHGYEHSGVGSALYAAIITLLRAQGFHTLYGIVTMPNDASEALHRRFGFREAARYIKQGYKLGEWRDVVWFELRLREPEGTPAPLRAFCELPADFVAEVLCDPYGLSKQTVVE